MKKIKTICIIGTGYAAYNHYQSFKNLINGQIYILTRKKKGNKNLKKFKSKRVRIIENLNNMPKIIDAYVVASHWLKNDFYFNFFKNEKKPILFEKPIGISYKSFFNLPKYKSNKFLGLNRRCFKTSIFLKKYLKTKKVIDANVNICENVQLFQKRFKTKKKNIFLFSSIHNIDLITFLFGEPIKIQKIKSFFNKQEDTGFFIFHYKNFKVKVTFLDNSSENSELTIRLKDKDTIFLTHNTNLKIYNGIKVKSKKDNKIYEPIIKHSFEEKDKFKFGFYNQANLFLKNKLTSSIDSYKITYNVIKKLS